MNLDFLGITPQGKIHKAGKLLESGKAEASRNPNAARRQFDQAQELLRSLPASLPERNGLLGAILMEIAQLEASLPNGGRSIDYLLEARSIGVVLNPAYIDLIATQFCLNARTDAPAIDIYLQTARQWAGNPARPASLAPVFNLLQHCCTITEGMSPAEINTRLELCNRVREQDDRLAFPYYYRGLHSFYTGNHAAALQDLTAAQERGFRSSDLDYYVNLSSAYMARNTGNLQKATASFVECAKIRPTLFAPNFEAGVCLVQLCDKEVEAGTPPSTIMKNRIDFASLALQRACSADPDSAEAHFYLGRTFYLARNFVQAVEAFKKATALNPTGTHYYHCARALWRSKDASGAITAAKRALELDPGLTLTRWFLASMAFRVEDYQTAGNEYRTILRATPNDANAAAGLGTCCYHLGDYAGAIQWLGALRERSDDARKMLARSFSRQNDFVNGERFYSELVQSNAPSAENFYFLGCCQAHQGRFEESIRSFNEAEQRGGLEQNVYLQRGCAWESLQKLEEARQDYRKALEKPGGESARLRLGLLCLRSREREEAITYLSQAGKSPEALRALALLHEERGDHTAADQAFCAAMAAAPADAATARQYGSALLQRGDTAEAVKQLASAARLGDSSEILRYNLGLAHFQTGDYPAAIAQWERLAAHPARRDNLKAACLLAGRQAREAQRYLEAVTYWEQAIEHGADAALLKGEIGKASVAQAILAAQSGRPQNVWEAPIRKAAEADPKNPAYQCILGALDLLRGDADGCVQRMERAKAKLDSRMQTTADYVLGLAYLQQGDAGQAEKRLEAASHKAKQQGLDLETEMPRAFALARLQRWAEAAEILCRMVK